MRDLGFFTYMASEELAAWVQAIGTIVAVIAAAYIASSHSRSDARRRAHEEGLAYDRACRMSTLFGNNLGACLSACAKAAGRLDEDEVRRQAAAMVSLLEWPYGAHLDRMPDDALLAFLRLRSIAREAHAYAATPGRVLGHDVAQRFSNWLIEARESTEELWKAFGVTDPV